VLEEAQRLYQFGQDAYTKGRYDVAFGSFNRVYQLTRSPDLLYNLAKVALKLDQKEVAIGYYRQYLSSHPADEAEVQKEMDALGGGPAPAPAPAAPPPPQPSDSDGKMPRWVPWAMIGGGTGLLGISLGLLLAGGISPAETAADQAQRRAMLAAGGVLGGIGLAATVGGVVLKVREKNARPVAAARTMMALAPWGAGMQLVGSY
jgi:tetratricopeptide (TPR) repeat protein